MSLNWQTSDALVHVENIRLFEMIKDASRKDGFERLQILAQYWKSVANELDRCGIVIKIDSMHEDRTQSWIVISRGVSKYVTELPEENKEPIHHGGFCSNPVATVCFVLPAVG